MTEQSEITESFGLLVERIAELELALEDQGWNKLAGDTAYEFSREGLRQICRASRLYYLKNPLIQRGLNVQRDYVFGQGVTIRSEIEEINLVIQEFLDDAKNRAELTSHQAMIGKEVELAVAGNVFFVFFVLPDGRVRVRTVSVDEIEEIICDPDDSKSPMYYRRVWVENRFDSDSGRMVTGGKTAYYPDWYYRPSAKPSEISGKPVLWGSPVFHVKVGGLPDMKFGVPEPYAALDWAKAYKLFLEDWATIVRSLSRFAWNVSVKGDKTRLAAAKTKLASTLPSDETNPAPVTASTFIGGEGSSISPIRTSGATTSAEDGRRLLLMVCATMGLPESFFGDVSIGTLATAKSLDRPTELKFRSRQLLWSDVFTSIVNFVIYNAVKAGELPGKVSEEDDGTPHVELYLTDENGEPVEVTFKIDFPPVVEQDIQQYVQAVVTATTLNGQAPAGTIDLETVSRLLLTALGVDDVDAIMDELYPQGEVPEEIPAPVPAPAPALAPGEPVPPEQAVINTPEAQRVFDAIRNVSIFLKELKETSGVR